MLLSVSTRRHFFQSPNGTIIKLRFLKPYTYSSECEAGKPFKPCQDYVEVRNNDNLGLTGEI